MSEQPSPEPASAPFPAPPGGKRSAREASPASLEALDRIRRMAGHEPAMRSGAREWTMRRRDEGASAEDRVGIAGQITYSKSGKDPRDPRSLGRVFGGIIGRRGWTTSLDVGQVTGRWHELVGPDIAAHCTVERFEPPALVVRASSTTWATQLKIMREAILDRLERELGRRVVEEIEILGPVQRSFTRGRRSVKGRGPRDTWG